MNYIKTFIIFLFVVLMLTTGKNVNAYSIPNFPACSNTNATLVASYSDGIHGIVGNYSTFRGSDKVYKLDSGDTLQCFCATDGKGIQTNWWKVSSLNQNEIQTLTNLGWIYVPDGAAWGLDPVSYLAKNEDYNCNSNSTTSSSSDNGNQGQVLGLAATGNSMLIFSTLILGLLLVVIGKELTKQGTNK